MTLRSLLLILTLSLSLPSFALAQTNTFTATPTVTHTYTPTHTFTPTHTYTFTPLILTAERIFRAGVLQPTPQALSTTYGNKIRALGNDTFIEVTNANESSRSVTFIMQRANSRGAKTNNVVTLTATQVKYVGPFHSREWADRYGNIVLFTSGSDVTARVYRNPSHDSSLTTYSP